MESFKCGYNNNGDYYRVLGVSSDSTTQQIRRAYHKLAMRWHPDRWTSCPPQLNEAKRKFQHIQQAYSVLTDERKRKIYDEGLYDLDDDEDEGFSDFLREMASLMAQTRREKKIYSVEELQTMLVEMAKGFQCNGSGCSKRMRTNISNNKNSLGVL